MSSTRPNLAARMGRWSADHRWTAVLSWVGFVTLAVVVGGLVGTVELPGADNTTGEARRAEQILDTAGFDVHAGERVLVQHPTLAADDAGFTAVVDDVTAALEHRPDVINLVAPTGPDAPPGLVSADGHSALVTFELAGDPEAAKHRVRPVLDAVAAVQADHPGFVVEQFGAASANLAVDATVDEDIRNAELLSLPVTLVILLLAFGTLVAASIPVLLAFSAVLASYGVSALVSHVVPAPSVTSSVILMIGMAVGVDYSLFYLRREREERAAGADRRTALLRAAATSGHAVLVSGVTVMIAMAGMLLSGSKIFTSIGVGTMIVVFVAMVGSVTVLPATLALLGDRVEKGRVPLLGRRRPSASGAGESRLWTAVLRPVLRRPGVATLAGVLGLAALALPALGLRTALPDFTTLPDDIPAVATYERIQLAFPVSPAPAVVVVAADDVTTPAVQSALADLRGKAVATGQMFEPVTTQVNADGTVAKMHVPLAGNGTDAASNAALATLRDDVIPVTVGAVDGVEVAVTGDTAGNGDFNATITGRAPVVFAFVLGLAFVLLLVTFRSVVVPIKAILLNLLSVGASYGVLVAVFQHGWGAGLVGASGGQKIASWLPLFLFVILFGLSMDYHVFILSRVKELVDRGMGTAHAVEQGIRLTAGTVTSAAVVMVAVFTIFATLRMVDIKQMGVGLAVAVLLDATVIRAVLLPASMKLLGEWNWYLPGWLAWLPGGQRAAQDAPAQSTVSSSGMTTSSTIRSIFSVGRATLSAQK
jgi:RND superfamily putative drug exporter